MLQEKREGRVDKIDEIISKRLFSRRCVLGYSQKDLADYTGVSIQQIQKYEKSTNRISGGRLYKFAKLLKVPVQYFFDSVELMLSDKTTYHKSFAEEQENFTRKKATTSTLEKEVITLIKFYNNIKDPNTRKRILELVKAVSTS